MQLQRRFKVTRHFKISFFVDTGDRFIDSKKRIWRAEVPIGYWKKNYAPTESTWVDSKKRLWSIGARSCKMIGKPDPDIEVVLKFEDQTVVLEPEKFVDLVQKKILVKIE
jgi:hypothetical protein